MGTGTERNHDLIREHKQNSPNIVGVDRNLGNAGIVPLAIVVLDLNVVILLVLGLFGKHLSALSIVRRRFALHPRRSRLEGRPMVVVQVGILGRITGKDAILNNEFVGRGRVGDHRAGDVPAHGITERSGEPALGGGIRRGDGLMIGHCIVWLAGADESEGAAA